MIFSHAPEIPEGAQLIGPRDVPLQCNWCKETAVYQLEELKGIFPGAKEPPRNAN
jgi:hypothetical protein